MTIGVRGRDRGRRRHERAEVDGVDAAFVVTDEIAHDDVELAASSRNSDVSSRL